MANKERISLRTLRWMGALAVTCISGTYVLTNQIHSNKSDVLSIQVANYKQKLEDSDSKLKEIERKRYSSPYSPAIGLVSGDSSKFKDIAEQVNQLEQRRNELLRLY